MNGIDLNFFSVTCLCGAVLAPLTLKEDVVGSNTTFYNFLL